jgi:hypothetical protein
MEKKLSIEEIKKEMAKQKANEPEFSKEKMLEILKETIEKHGAPIEVQIVEDVNDLEKAKFKETMENLPKELQGLDPDLITPAGALVIPELEPEISDSPVVRFYASKLPIIFEKICHGSELSFMAVINFVVAHEFRHAEQYVFFKSHGLDIKAIWADEMSHPYSHGPMETDANAAAQGNIQDLDNVFAKWLVA